MLLVYVTMSSATSSSTASTAAAASAAALPDDRSFYSSQGGATIAGTVDTLQTGNDYLQGVIGFCQNKYARAADMTGRREAFKATKSYLQDAVKTVAKNLTSVADNMDKYMELQVRQLASTKRQRCGKRHCS